MDVDRKMDRIEGLLRQYLIEREYLNLRSTNLADVQRRVDLAKAVLMKEIRGHISGD